MNVTEPNIKFLNGKYNLHCVRCDTTIKYDLSDLEIKGIRQLIGELEIYWCRNCQQTMKKLSEN